MNESRNDEPRNAAAELRARGFSVLPRFLDEAERRRLQATCDAVLAATRAIRRGAGHSTPRISILADGDLAAAEEVARFFASARVCALLDAVAPPRAATPVLKDVHYYHEQTSGDWEGDWHRDSQLRRPDTDAEQALIRTTEIVHLRVAFATDDRLEIVPGSHARWDTPEELAIRKGADRATARMPGAVRIALRAGDGCLFHAWSIHRATYRREPVRRTLDAIYAFGAPASFADVG